MEGSFVGSTKSNHIERTGNSVEQIVARVRIFDELIKYKEVAISDGYLVEIKSKAKNECRASYTHKLSKAADIFIKDRDVKEYIHQKLVEMLLSDKGSRWKK